MNFKLDNEKRNLLRWAIYKNHKSALRLHQQVKMIQQVKLELAFLQVRRKITDESLKELTTKYNKQLVKLYEEFSWSTLEKQFNDYSSKPSKQSSI